MADVETRSAWPDTGRGARRIPGVGVIGGGIWAAHHLQAGRDLEREGRARLVAACTRAPQSVARIVGEFGIEGTTDYRELLARPDVDAVSIVTPDHLHCEMALAAIEVGKHVIVEKPMDLTLEGCDAMVRAAHARGVVLFVDFHKRYDRAFQRVRQMIACGELGRVQYGYAYMEDAIVVPRDWFPAWAANTTPFWFIGVHQVDLLRWLLDAEVARVSARGYRHKLVELGIDTYDSVHSDLEFDNGAAFSVDVSWIIPERFEAIVNQGLRIVGSEGFAEIDTQDRGVRTCVAKEGTRTLNVDAHHRWPSALGVPVNSGYFVQPVKDFLEVVGAVVNGGDLAEYAGQYPSGDDGREATRVAVAVHESIVRGAPVDLVRGQHG
jgi:predicted dehydrogenase